MRVFAVALLVVAACKDKTSAPSKAPASATTPAPAQRAGDRRLETGDSAQRPAQLPPVIEAQQVAPLLPKLGPELAPLRATSDGRQLHTSWCVSDPEAAGAAITQAGWTNLERRGTGPRSGVSAERDGYRLSIVLAPSSGTACTGFAANATIFRL